MKKLPILSFIFISSLIFYTCQKEEIQSEIITPTEQLTKNEIVTPRSGFVDVVFYRTSLTSDNILMSGNANYFRTYNIFNKTKIDSIVFVATGNGLINYGGILLKHYTLFIHFKNTSEPYKFTAFSKSTSNNFTFIPTSSDQLLTTSNSAKIVKFEIQSTGSVRHNFWSGTNLSMKNVKIYKDNILMETRILDPINKNSNIFNLPHAH